VNLYNAFLSEILNALQTVKVDVDSIIGSQFYANSRKQAFASTCRPTHH